MACASRRWLLIVGASARAAAQSAIRAGWAPWCADLFADRDLRAIAPVSRCPLDAYPQALVGLVAGAPLPADAPLLYTGGLENHPRVLEDLGHRRTLLGCTGPTASAVRDPAVLAAMPARPGLGVCPVSAADPGAGPPGRRWLLKPRRGTGGRGIRRWHTCQSVGHAHYLQARIPGRPISAVYVTGAGRAELAGASWQVVGDASFGGAGFRYCGSIGPLPLSAAQRGALADLGSRLAARFDLRGPIGIDAVLDRQGVIWPVEVNPRYTASVEIVEATTGRALLAGPPWIGEPPPAPPAAGCLGKAIVFARRRCVVPDLYRWFNPAQIADVPDAGTVVARSWPVCTVRHEAADPAGCRRGLRLLAAGVYTRLG